MPDPLEVGFLDQEIVDEQLPADIDRNNLWWRNEIRRQYRMLVEILAPRRPW
jgi:hypothetical protein